LSVQNGEVWGARSSRSPWGASRAPFLPGFVPVHSSPDWPQKESRSECVWRDAKHRARNARAPQDTNA
jgi:hypothetical protein